MPPGQPGKAAVDRAARTTVAEPLTYERHNLKSSYLLDLARAHTGLGDNVAARTRLERHADEMCVEIPRREKVLQQAFTRDFEALIDAEIRAGLVSPQVASVVMGGGYQLRGVGRMDGSAGEFTPPMWVLEAFAPQVRPGRPFADKVNRIPLPGGTESINIPILTVGGLTGFQTQDGQPVASQDWQSSAVVAPVRTIVGDLDVSMQVLEQSGVGFDQVAFADLAFDYAAQLDKGCIAGIGGLGQLLGILNVAGIGTSTFTSGSPTGALLYPKVAGALNTVAQNRKRLASALWMQAQRWYWLASQLDSQGRPFLPPVPEDPATAGTDPAGEGRTQTLVMGSPALVDQSIPTNLGGGTNEDRMIATVMSDHVLFESDFRLRVMTEPLAGTLGARLQLYAYVAFTAGRFPTGTCVVSGTGLSTPSF